jgi:DUF1009 family protein
MGSRIGLIAGSGDFPLIALAEAKAKGLFTAVLSAGAGEPEELRVRADVWARLDPLRPTEAAAFLKKHGIRDVLLAGKFDPALIFRPEGRDAAARAAVRGAPDRRPAGLAERAIAFFDAQGFRVVDPSPFLEPFLCPEGLLGATEPSAGARDDMAFGWPLARVLADQDIGQTLVVKDRMVVAVEGLEGTDEAVRRGGRLAGPGVVVLKRARTGQKAGVDFPAVGLGTVRTLVEAGASALCLEAGRTAFFQREEAVALADSKGIALTGRRK